MRSVNDGTIPDSGYELWKAALKETRWREATEAEKDKLLVNMKSFASTPLLSLSWEVVRPQ